MTIWKPCPSIRVKVLGLAWRGRELLMAEVEDSSGRIKGVRPLGGSVEFRETREKALVREFEEELGCPVRLAGPWHALENIYEHEGAIGHEYIFAANIELGRSELYERDRIRFLEDEGTPCMAGWFEPTALAAGVALYPGGLLALIQSGGISRAG